MGTGKGFVFLNVQWSRKATLYILLTPLCRISAWRSLTARLNLNPKAIQTQNSRFFDTPHAYIPAYSH